MLTAMLCGIGAALMCAALLPSAIAIAPLIGAVDLPRDERRMHKKPTPRCGGMAMFVALWSIFAVLGIRNAALLPLLLATGVLMLMGLADDVFGLPAIVKLLGQMAAALAVAGTFANGVVGVALTVFWLSLITNAHNMIDGLDGLCGSVVAVESGALALLLLLCGDTLGMLLALGVLGCCLGYLPYNLHPARLFMGDEGALFLGFFVGWLTLRAYAAYDAPLLLPLLCLLPLTDLSFAVLRRLLRGQSPFRADRGHLHHRLCDSGFSQRKTVAMLLVISILGALLALIAVI